MKRFLALAATLLFLALPGFAQESKTDDANVVREYKNKVFVVQNGSARDIAAAIKLLGSGFKGSGLSINEELRTITVRDFPENVAAIEEAIKRLDHSAPASPGMELKVSVLIGSKTPLTNASVPDELAPVIKQLRSTLTYAHYGVMTTSVHRTKIGSGIEGSGVAESTLLGLVAVQTRPILYTYHLRNISFGPNPDASTINVENFQFSMRVPIDTGDNHIQYQSVGFETPVSLRQHEKVVIGTTTMGDKALIVVVTANVDQ